MVSLDSSDRYLYVADTDNSMVRCIELASGIVFNIGESANPPFSLPRGVSIDSIGQYLYVADSDNSLVRRVDLLSGIVTNIGESANPAFVGPHGLSVDRSGKYLYVADTDNNLIRRVDLISGIVTNVGTSASPTFNKPQGVTVDNSGQYLYVADTDNSLIWRINLVETTSNVLLLSPPHAFSVHLDNGVFTEFPIQSFVKLPGEVNAVTSSGCQGIAEDKICLSLIYSEYNAENSTLWFDYVMYATGYHFFQAHSAASTSQPPPPIVLSSSSPGRALLATLYSPLANSMVLFTTGGALSSTVSTAFPPLDMFPTFNTLVGERLVQDASKIPPSPADSPTRYLLLSTSLGDDLQTVIYDAFTDSIISSNNANGAPTHYMLSYSYGLCGSQVTRDLVESSYSSDFSNICSEGDGLYYQGPNAYYSFPVECLGLPFDQMLKQCAPIATNQKALVDASCTASIEKICTTQYTKNPPFSCSTVTYSDWLTVLSLSISNTLTVYALLSMLIALIASRIYAGYRPSEEDLAEVNDPASYVQTVDNLLLFCIGIRPKEKVEEKGNPSLIPSYEESTMHSSSSPIDFSSVEMQALSLNSMMNDDTMPTTTTTSSSSQSSIVPPSSLPLSQLPPPSYLVAGLTSLVSPLVDSLDFTAQLSSATSTLLRYPQPTENPPPSTTTPSPATGEGELKHSSSFSMP